MGDDEQMVKVAVTFRYSDDDLDNDPYAERYDDLGWDNEILYYDVPGDPTTEAGREQIEMLAVELVLDDYPEAVEAEAKIIYE